MPLVQSLDILRQRVANANFKAVLDGVYREGERPDRAVGRVRRAPDLFPAVYAASLMAAGAVRQSRRGASADTVAYEKGHRGASGSDRTISALIYPDHSRDADAVPDRIIVLRVVPAFSEFYSQFGKQLPLSTRIIVGISDRGRQLSDHRRRRRLRRLSRAGELVKQRGQQTRVDRWMLRLPWAARRCGIFADRAAGPHAGDAAGRRHPAGQRARDRGPGDDQPLSRAETREVSQRVREV
jgi:type II secretory pathway component PulF